jgi:hypothetical protein
MDVHSNDMLNGDCFTCHSSGPRFPVILGSSAGGNGLDPISCAGCHGRAEDGTGEGSVGFDAGLRQHHWVANRTDLPTGCDPAAPPGDPDECLSTRICADCHDDADPGAFTTAAESVLPPYYANPGTNHPDMPSDPCNLEIDGFPEDYAGSTEGLDNDGDGFYDDDDNNNIIACPEPGQIALLLPGIGVLLLIDRRRQRSQAR